MHMGEGAYGERVDVYMNERGYISVCMYVCMYVHGREGIHGYTGIHLGKRGLTYMHMDEGAYGERVDVYMNERGYISVCMYV